MKFKVNGNKKRILGVTGALIVALSIGGVSYALTRPVNTSVSQITTTDVITPAASTDPSVSTSPQSVSSNTETQNDATPSSSPSESPKHSASPTTTPKPTFDLRSLSMSYIEQHSMTDACKDHVTGQTNWSITGDAWLQKVYDLIETKQWGIQSNSEGHIVCIYWNTINELKG